MLSITTINWASTLDCSHKHSIISPDGITWVYNELIQSLLIITIGGTRTLILETRLVDTYEADLLSATFGLFVSSTSHIMPRHV